MKLLRLLMLITDIGFLLYWAITLTHLIPETYLFKDYHNPILQAWNWSFLPLDLLISCTGITALLLYRKCGEASTYLTLISLTLTSISGLQAVAFWSLRGDFDPAWWGPNLFLLCYPLPFIGMIITKRIR